ncbi:MAG TPA: YihY/virulence factor BrkB family protein [Vicinamibacterales bacterium]|nr:YihY/virulence factor BrkB family protein [Vicinamibacterales bacterium]
MSATATRSGPLVRALARLRRAGRLAWRATYRGVFEFYNSSNLTFASSIAYYSLLSMFPFLALVVALLSKFAVGRETLLPMIASGLPSNLDFVVSRVESIAQTPIGFSVFGLVLTVWASMGVFGAITSAVNHAWGVENPLGFFRHQLVAFVMMLCSGLLMAFTVLLVSLVQVIEARWFEGVLARFPELAAFTGLIYSNLPTPMFILVVGLIYYFIPNAKVRLRDVWFGAILAGVLWRLALWGFTWYVRDLDRFRNFHGSVTSIVVFLMWVYLSAIILLFGCEVTAAFARERKHLPSGVPAAPVLQPPTGT